MSVPAVRERDDVVREFMELQMIHENGVVNIM